MPLFSSISKQEATRSYGAEVVLQGRSLLESIEIATRMAEDTGRLFVHPYDDPEVIAGQGTIGLEILEDLPDVDLVLVPVGGGGLIGGIATALKALRPRTRVVGVQAEACPSASAALAAGAPVTVDATDVSSIADAIMVTRIGDLAFPLLQNLVDGLVAVDEDKISSAMLLLLERKRILAEGAGAVALAALLCRKLEVPEGGSVVLVISGGNVDSLLLDRVVHRGLLQEGRLMSISVCLEDSPGSLARLLAVLADHQANVVHIHHDRDDPRLPMGSIRVSLDLETRGLHHIKEVL